MGPTVWVINAQTNLIKRTLEMVRGWGWGLEQRGWDWGMVTGWDWGRETGWDWGMEKGWVWGMVRG